jgi:hypothetical protein
MRRSRLLTLLGGSLLAALLVPSAALAATPAATTQTADPTIRLRCALVIPAGSPGRERVGCGWTALTGVDVRAYRVWKTVDAGLGRPRHLIARVTPDEPLRIVDHHIRRGHTYTYRVVAIGTDGSRVGFSNAEWLRVGWRAERIGLNCAFVIDAARQGVACRWAKADRPGAARFVLVRSVDGGPREPIYRTADDGRRSYFDTDVAAGQSIRYKVFALAVDGRIVGVSRADTVLVPTLATS